MLKRSDCRQTIRRRGVPTIYQSAALPYRADGAGNDATIRVLLITSRETKRWVIPKGNMDRSGLPHLSAAREAKEEAGVCGIVCPTPIGTYRYWKRRRSGASSIVDVDVFAMAVTRELASWREQDERQRRWLTLAEAADAVEEEDLAELLRSFGATDFKVGG